MEAMACGLPVVAMDAGDIPYLVEEGRTGFVVRQGEEATFVKRISQLIADDQLCLRMGSAARAKAEREFKAGTPYLGNAGCVSCCGVERNANLDLIRCMRTG